MFKEKNSLSFFDVVIVVAIGIFAAIFSIEKIYNYDLWWHLRSGQWIVANNAIPYTDPFSFSTEGAKWVNTSWLSGVLFYLLQKASGLNALIIFKAVCIGLTFSGACLFMIREKVHPLMAAFFLGYAVIVARFRFLLRPSFLTFPFLIILLSGFSSLTKDSAKKVFLWFIPFTVVWVNLHGSAYLVPVFACFLLVESVLIKRFNISEDADRIPGSKFALLLFLVATGSVLLTPYLFDVPQMIVERTIVQDVILDDFIVDEHRALRWGEHKAYWALMVMTGISFILRGRKLRLFYLLTYLGTAFLALTSVRYVGLSAFLQAIFLGVNVSSLLKGKLDYPVFKKPLTLFITTTVLLFLGIFSFRSTFTPNKVYQWGLGVNESRYPVKAVEYLKNINYSGNIYNLWEQGGYLLWYLPESKTLFDGRALDAQFELIPKLNEMNFIELRSYFKNVNVTAAILPTGENAVNVFKTLPEFSLHYFDGDFLVFLHENAGVTSDDVQGTEFNYIRPETYEVTYLDKYVKTPLSDRVESELYRAVDISPRNFVMLYQLAYYLEKMNKPEAVDFYIRAINEDPALAFSHFKLELSAAQFAMKHKQFGKVELLIDMARQYGKESAHHYFLLGTAQYQNGDLENAEKNLRIVIGKKPQQVAAIENLGFLLVDKEHYVEAEKFFAKALEFNPNSEAAFYGYAFASYKLKKDNAAVLLEKFLRKFPGSKWAGNVQILLRENE